MPARKAFLIALSFALLAVGRPAASSSDHYWPQLWGMKKIGADKAWAVGTGKGVTIAVVDTGVDPNHEDLKRNIVPGYDFVAHDNDPRDEFGHGTHVAGIAAAVANNGIGVAGVAPDAKIMPVRVLDSTGSGSSTDVESGIRWAADHGADVINLSLGDNVVIEDVSGGTMSNAVNYAWSKGAICVISSGNDKFFRTDQTKAIIVTATAQDDSQASYATGVGLAPWGMAAPGGDSNDPPSSAILSTYWSKSGKSKYAYAMGTSMAAPHVSGAAAVLRSLGLTPQQTVDRLLATARDIGSSGNDLTFGHGLLDVAAAVKGMHPVHNSKAGSVTSAPSAPYASSGPTFAPGDRSRSASNTGTAIAAPTTSSSRDARTSSAPGFAVFSPTPIAHKGNGWALGLIALGIGGASLGLVGFQLLRRRAG